MSFPNIIFSWFVHYKKKSGIFMCLVFLGCMTGCFSESSLINKLLHQETKKTMATDFGGVSIANIELLEVLEIDDNSFVVTTFSAGCVDNLLYEKGFSVHKVASGDYKFSKSDMMKFAVDLKNDYQIESFCNAITIIPRKLIPQFITMRIYLPKENDALLLRLKVENSYAQILSMRKDSVEDIKKAIPFMKSILQAKQISNDIRY